MSRRAAVLGILIGGVVVVGCQRMGPAGMIEVIGVFRDTTDAPYHLIELRVRGVQRPFDVGDFTQQMPGRPPSDWQVPWMERILNEDGTQVVADDADIWRRPELFRGDVRFVFFFHHLDPNRPLLTPFGTVRLPKPTDRPGRLGMIQYEEPD